MLALHRHLNQIIRIHLLVSHQQLFVSQDHRCISLQFQNLGHLRGSVTSANPLLQPRPTSAQSVHPTGKPVPYLSRIGIEIIPHPRVQCTDRILINQVCDAIRLTKATLRPVGYRIVPELGQAISRLRAAFPDCVVVLLIYCHCLIAELPHNPFDHVIVTSERIWTGGKLFALGALAHQSCGSAHIDEATDIAEKISTASGRNPNILFVGVKVPRHWRHQRLIQTERKRNVLEAIELARASCIPPNPCPIDREIE